MNRKAGFNNMTQSMTNFMTFKHWEKIFFPVVLSLHYSSQIQKPRAVTQ